MNRDIEDRLRKYRPSGPAPELRDRVLRTMEGAVVARPFQGLDRRVFLREWLPATLAATVAIIFHLLASNAHDDVASRLGDADRAHEAIVTELATQLGGDEFARQSAEQLVEANEQAARDQPDSPEGIDVLVTNHD
jgi:hypothetical protein